MRLPLALPSVLAGAAIAAAAMTAGCSDEHKDAFGGAVVYDDFPVTAAGADRSDDLEIAHAFVLQAGFAAGKAVQYADLGPVNAIPPRMYLLVRDGAPVTGQYPIIDTLPDKADYGPWWQVVTVEVPSGYRANDLKSLAGLKDAGYAMTPTLEAAHCAVVNPDAKWLTADLSATLNVFWATGELQPNPYFDPEAAVGPDNPVVVTEAGARDGDIVLQPVWHKRLRGFCFTEGFEHRLPLVADADDPSVVTLDGAELGARYQVGALPVFGHAASDPDYTSLVADVDTVSTVNGQPGSTADVDAEGGAVAGLADAPILADLALDRFEVTVANTTPPEPDRKARPFGQGALIVADDTTYRGSAPVDYAYLFEVGVPVAAALETLIAQGDNVPLATAFSGDPLSGAIADYLPLAATAPEASYQLIVLATPGVGVLTLAHDLPTLEEPRLTGVAGLPLYDAGGAPVATQTVDLAVYDAGYETESGKVTLIETATPVGTVTIRHLGL